MPARAERMRSVRLSFPASPWEVRLALQEMLDRLALSELDPDLPGTLEIVMAEVLNNVVEHAYRERQGMIDLEVIAEEDGLRCRVIDFGVALAGAKLPDGRLPAPDPAGLPEGGFGWFLITSLACDIAYIREGGANSLSFLVASKAALPLA